MTQFVLAKKLSTFDKIGGAKKRPHYEPPVFLSKSSADIKIWYLHKKTELYQFFYRIMAIFIRKEIIFIFLGNKTIFPLFLMVGH